uniref:Uncharacterized protein n=1 Tax=Gossypium raimondii TaxID=29730 RepID=A0A0D2QQP8_GOSRA|nr:hypothetical protein B456_003G094200 [Gossypium raimondii]
MAIAYGLAEILVTLHPNVGRTAHHLFCILSPVSLLPRALRNRLDLIDIPSTQHRSSKGSRRLTKARKPGSFRKWIPIRRVHNCMDKLTLTRQFRIQFGISLGVSIRNWNVIILIHIGGKGSLLIQMLYLWDRDRERGKTEDFRQYF